MRGGRISFHVPFSLSWMGFNALYVVPALKRYIPGSGLGYGEEAESQKLNCEGCSGQMLVRSSGQLREEGAPWYYVGSMNEGIQEMTVGNNREGAQLVTLKLWFQ